MRDNWLKIVGRSIFRRPFVSAIVIWAVLSVAFWVSPLAPEFYNEQLVSGYADLDAIGGIGFWLIFGIIGLCLQDKFITYVHSDSIGIRDKEVLLKISAKGEVIETDLCFWGNSNICRVRLPGFNFWDSSTHKYIGGFTTSTDIVNVWPNCRVSIPVTITVATDGNYNYQELYNKVTKPQNISDGNVEINIEVFAQKLISDSIEENSEFIRVEIKKYIDENSSSAVLLSKIVEVLDFPKRALGNFKDAEICLGAPEVRACKGANCYSYHG